MHPYLAFALLICGVTAQGVKTAVNKAPLQCNFEMRDPVTLPNGGVARGVLIYEWNPGRMLFSYNNGLRDLTIYNQGNGLVPAGQSGAGVKCSSGNTQTTFCDKASNCVTDCCLSTGICPSSSCIALGAPNNAQANCAGSCLKEVACVAIVASCNPNQQHCLGTTVCTQPACGGRKAGEYCIFDGVSKNFKICSGAVRSNPPPSPPDVSGQYNFQWFTKENCQECKINAWDKSQPPLFKDPSLLNGDKLQFPVGSSGVSSIEFDAQNFPTKMTLSTGRSFTFSGCANQSPFSPSLFTTPGGCTCGKPLDVVLVLDRSCSIDQGEEWDSVKSFVTQLSAAFTYGPNNVNLGLTNFHKWTWDGPVTLATGSTQSSVSSGVSALQCAGTENRANTQCIFSEDFSILPLGTRGASCCGCGTSISAGIISGADMLASTIRPGIPSIRDKAAKIMIVITDGFHNKILRKDAKGALVRKEMKNPDGKSTSMKPQGEIFKIRGKECEEKQGSLSAADWADCKKALNDDIIWSVQTYSKGLVPNLQVFAVGVGEVWEKEQLQFVADNKPNQVFGTRSFKELSSLVSGIVTLACQSSEGDACSDCVCGGVCVPCKGCIPPDTCDNDNLCTTNSLAGTCCKKTDIIPPNCTEPNKCKIYGCNKNLNDGKGGCTAVSIPVREPSTCQNFTCDPATGNTIAKDILPTKCVTDADCKEPCLIGRCITNPQSCLNRCDYTPVACPNDNKCITRKCDPAQNACVNTTIPIPALLPPLDRCQNVTCIPSQGIIYTDLPGSTNCCRNNSDCDDGNKCTENVCVDRGTPQARCVTTTIPCIPKGPCVNATCTPLNGCVDDPLPKRENTRCVEFTFNTTRCAWDGKSFPNCSECVTELDCDRKENNKCKTTECITVIADSETNATRQICNTTGDVVCSDDDACTTNSCDPREGCITTNDTCPDDGNVCTIEKCLSNATSPETRCITEPVVCPPGDDCNDVQCDPTKGCQSTPIECPSSGNCTLSGCKAKTDDGTRLGCFYIVSNEENGLDCGFVPPPIISAVTGAVVGGIVVAAVGGALITSGATAPMVFTAGAGAGVAGGAHPNPLYVPAGGEGVNPLQK